MAASEAAGGEAEAAQEEVKASEGEAGGVPTEAQLRAHIVGNRPAIQNGATRSIRLAPTSASTCGKPA